MLTAVNKIREKQSKSYRAEIKERKTKSFLTLGKRQFFGAQKSIKLWLAIVLCNKNIFLITIDYLMFNFPIVKVFNGGDCIFLAIKMLNVLFRSKNTFLCASRPRLQSLTIRQLKFVAIKTNIFKVGGNLLCNRLSILNESNSPSLRNNF